MRRDVPGLLAVGCLLPLVGIVVWLAGRPLATDDFWYHLKLGEVYAQEGLRLDADPMFFTAPDQPTVPQEWLFQVALHGVHSVVGFHGLRAIHAAVAAAIVALVFACFRRTGAPLASTALATALFVCVAWYRLFQLRPDLFSIPATLALYALLFADERVPGWRRVALTLLVLLVWVNAHSLFAVALALVLAGLLGGGLEALALRLLPPGEQLTGSSGLALARRLAAVLGLGALVTLANPRGLEQHATFFVESGSGDIWTLLDEFAQLHPLVPPAGNPGLTTLAWLATDLLLVAFAAAVALGLVRLARERTRDALRDLDPVHLGLAAAGALAGLVAIRFLWLAVFPLLYLLRWQARALARRPSARGAQAWAAAAACAVLAVAFPPAIPLEAYAQETAAEPGGYWRSAWLDERYCGAGMRFLRDAGLRGHLFQPFNVGGFFGYWLAPGVRTFIDGRLDHVPSEVLEDYLRLRLTSQADMPRALRDFVERWDVEIFLGFHFPAEPYSDASWIPHLRRLPDWIPVFVAEHCGVYLRRAADGEENLRRAEAWAAKRRLPFDPERGIDASELIRRRPAWARQQGVLPEDYRAIDAARRRPEADQRAAALDRLGQLYARIGAFRDGVESDRALLELEPAHREARRRLADGLLLLGRPAEALAVLEPLYREDPGYADVRAIREAAIERARAAPSADANGAGP